MIQPISLLKTLCLAGGIAVTGATQTQAVLLYNFDYETDLTTNNGGTGTNTLDSVGSPGLYSGGPAGSAQFTEFLGGNSATSDHQVLGVSSDTISFSNFRIEFSFNNFGFDSAGYDDFLSIRHSGHSASESIGVQFIVPGHATAPNGLAFRGVGGGFSAAVNDSNWHKVVITGSASALAADADLEISLDGVVFAGNTITGGAAHTLDTIQISGRPDGANNRFVAAGFDNVMIYNSSTVPEPSSVALLGLGGFAMLLRRRKK